jgi:PKD repeat protein
LSQITSRSILALIAFLTLIAVNASPALAAPTASFTASATGVTGTPVTFDASASMAPATFTITSTEWDFSYNGTTFNAEGSGASIQHPFPEAGTYAVAVRVTSSEPLDNQATSAPQNITIAQANRPPRVSGFAFSPVSPLIGDDVLFAADASDPDGNVLTYAWSFGDITSASVQSPNVIHKYMTTPGSKTVTLKVTDSAGASAPTITRQITVRGLLVPGNALPVVGFIFSPNSPRAGDAVEFASTTSDPEGALREQAWDLDGDGQFDDATGDRVLYTFRTAGPKVVRQRATDGAGGTAIGERTVTVLPAPKAKPGFLSPPPSVTLGGTVLSTGMRVKTLTIEAPRGALVTVKCRGKGCGVSRRRKHVKRSTVRFKTYERFLRAGTKLEIYVRKPKMIGAFRRYTIKAGKFPVDIKRCLPVGKDTPKKHCS